MKSVVLAFSFAALASCGTQVGSSPSGEPGFFNPAIAEVSSADHGQITKVEHFTLPFTTPNGALGGLPQTHITVQYDVECWKKFESFSYETEIKDGKLVLYTNALLSQSKELGDVLCQGSAFEEKILVVKGNFAKEDITLVQLSNDAKVDLTADIHAVTPAKSVKVFVY